MTIPKDSHWMAWFKGAVARGDSTMIKQLRNEALKQANSYLEMVNECNDALAQMENDQPADNVVSIGAPVRARA